MAEGRIKNTELSAIAAAIRSKNGESTAYKPAEMAQAILDIPTGSAVLESLSVTQNGSYTPGTGVDGYSSVSVNVPNSYGSGDEGKIVHNGELVALNLQSKTATQNGTVTPDSGYDGLSSVEVNVSGGGGEWRDSLSVNWDFSNPVNTRGSSTYGSSNLIYTIDGWQLQGGVLTFSTGGIKLAQYAAGTNGFFMQRYKSDATSALVGQTLTLSIIIDGTLYTGTVAFTSGSGNKITVACDGISMRLYNYGSEVALTLDILAGQADRLIQAIKLEAGDAQTLATQVNGVWVLNNSMDADTEYIKARNGTVYNS